MIKCNSCCHEQPSQYINPHKDAKNVCPLCGDGEMVLQNNLATNIISTIKELSTEGLKNLLEVEFDDRNTLERLAQNSIDDGDIDEIEFIMELSGE